MQNQNSKFSSQNVNFKEQRTTFINTQTWRKQFFGKKLLLGKSTVPIEQLKENTNTATRPISLRPLLCYCQRRSRQTCCGFIHFLQHPEKKLKLTLINPHKPVAPHCRTQKNSKFSYKKGLILIKTSNDRTQKTQCGRGKQAPRWEMQ